MVDRLKALVQRDLHLMESCSMAIYARTLSNDSRVVLALITSRRAVAEGERALFEFGVPSNTVPQESEDPLPLHSLTPLTKKLVTFIEIRTNDATGAPQLEITRETDTEIYEATDDVSGNMSSAKSFFFVVKQCAQLPLPMPDPSLNTRDEQPFGWTFKYRIVGGQNGTQSTSSETMFRQKKADAQAVTVFFGTWNVNGQNPPNNLDLWLSREGMKPDIYCIGFQELDLSASALMLGDTSKAEPWINCIAETLGKYGDYVKLATKQLVGILLCVFVRRAMTKCISDVQSDIMPVGIMGVMGNKGGVGIQFNINDNSFCVVNSHLNAHMDNVTRRNQDFRDIARELVFFRQGRRITIWDHDFLFWIGDLNYRILGSDAEVRNRILRGDYEYLLKRDQLKEQQREKKAFVAFTEAEINFAPTYKYDHNSTYYDTSSQSRCPAWCDRILWREPDPAVTGPGAVTNFDYMRHELLTSDHRPVSALFVIRTKISHQRILRSAYQSMQFERLPQQRPASIHPQENREAQQKGRSAQEVVFSATELDFGVVSYMNQLSRKLIIRNTGSVPTQWQLQPKASSATPSDGAARQQQPFCKPWFQVAPTSGELQPGEQAAILVAVCVDRSTAHLLVPTDMENVAAASMTDTLTVSLGGVKEYPIVLTADYQCSCFGLTLEQLVRFVGPVRTSLPQTQRAFWIPKELWRLVNELCSNPQRLDTPELFMKPGKKPEMRLIRDAIDTGAPFPGSVSLHSVAALILQFLDQLGKPVIPSEVYTQLPSKTHADCKHLLTERLSDEQYTTFYYIISFLRELLRHSEKNGLTPERLAVIFSDILIRSPETSRKQGRSGAVEEEEDDEDDETHNKRRAQSLAVSEISSSDDGKKDADFVIYRFLIE